MRDVVKTNVKREQNHKRKKRRRRNSPFRFFLLFLIVAGIGILLSVTLLFNIETITVNGDVDYKKDDIVRVSGIGQGDNLVRLDSNEAEQKILSSMIYIETVEIDKQYPSSLVINVTKCTETAYVECESGYLVISEKGKILDVVEETSKSMMIVKGFEVVSEDKGSFIQSADEQKNEIIYDFLEQNSEEDVHEISIVDMTDKYEIEINYENRITFDMGNSTEIPYKLNLAESVLCELNNDKEGYMTMVGTNQISFRDLQDVTQDAEGDRTELNEEDMPATDVSEYTESYTQTDEEQETESYSESETEDVTATDVSESENIVE